MRDAIETQDRPISNNLLGLNRGRSEDSDDAMDTEIDRKTHQMFDRLTDAYYRASASFDAYLHFRQTRGRMFEEALPRVMRPARLLSFALGSQAPVTESARTHSYYSSKQVLETC